MLITEEKSDGYFSSSGSDTDSDSATSSSSSTSSHQRPLRTHHKHVEEDPFGKMISMTTTSSFYYPYTTLHMSHFERYSRFIVHLIIMPFVQGVFQGIGELCTRGFIRRAFGTSHIDPVRLEQTKQDEARNKG